MSERPILFSAWKLRYILGLPPGQPFQTRRVIKHRHAYRTFHEKCTNEEARARDGEPLILRPEDEAEAKAWLRDHCPYGEPSDRPWVRETWAPNPYYSATNGLPKHFYRADGPDRRDDGPWRSPIFMPRAASRLTLEVLEVRVQRLHEISEEDARAEGAPKEFRVSVDLRAGRVERIPVSHRGGFVNLWENINGKRAPWASNPWVWALTFKRLVP